MVATRQHQRLGTALRPKVCLLTTANTIILHPMAVPAMALMGVSSLDLAVPRERPFCFRQVAEVSRARFAGETPKAAHSLTSKTRLPVCAALQNSQLRDREGPLTYCNATLMSLACLLQPSLGVSSLDLGRPASRTAPFLFWALEAANQAPAVRAEHFGTCRGIVFGTPFGGACNLVRRSILLVM